MRNLIQTDCIAEGCADPAAADAYDDDDDDDDIDGNDSFDNG